MTSTSTDSLQSQLQTAIVDAIQSAGDSGSVSDLETAIRNAVDKTLKANGIDPTKFDAQAAASDASTTSSSSTTSTTSSSDASSQSTELSHSLQQLLASLFGVQNESASLVGNLVDNQG